MRPLAPLMRRQLRRTRRQSALVGLLIVLTAALANIGLMCATSYSGNLETTARELNTEQIAFATLDDSQNQAVLDAMNADERVSAVESTKTRPIFATFEYGGTDNSSMVALLDIDDEVTMGVPRVVEELDDPVEHPVYLPYIMKAGGGYALGDEIVLRTSDGDLTFHVQGFVESVMLGAITSGLTGMWVPGDEFAALASGPASATGALVKATVADGADDEQVITDVSSAIASEYRAAGQHPPEHWTGSLSMTMSFTAFVPGFFAISLIFFATITMLSVLVVIRFLVKNSIVRDMPGIGTLKALGFTSAQIMTSYLGYFLTGALVTAAAGVAASYALLPVVAGTLSDQTGVIWEPGFSVLGLAGILAVVGAAVAITTLIAGLRIRSVPPVHALRGGLPTHSFARNPLPLDRTRVPLAAALGVKSALRRVSQGAAVALVVGLVTVTSVFSVALYTNVLADTTRFANLVIGDFPEIVTLVQDDADRDAVRSEVSAVDGVQKAVYNELADVSSEGQSFMVMIMDDYADQRVSAVYEGRDPQHDNEIALGATIADRLDVGVGDPIVVDIGDNQVTFVVSGLVQTARNFGTVGEVTTAGFQSLDPTFVPTQLSVYIEPDADIETVLDDLRGLGGESVRAAVDNASSMDSQIQVYVGAAGVLAAAIIAITIAVVALVISLVVTTTLTQERRSLGIHKALGFTNRELMIQTCISFLPPVAIGVALGVLAGALVVNPLLSMAFGSIGLVRMRLALDSWLLLALAGGILLLAVLLTLWRSRRIGRISAYSLVTE